MRVPAGYSSTCSPRVTTVTGVVVGMFKLGGFDRGGHPAGDGRVGVWGEDHVWVHLALRSDERAACRNSVDQAQCVAKVAGCSAGGVAANVELLHQLRLRRDAGSGAQLSGVDTPRDLFRDPQVRESGPAVILHMAHGRRRTLGADIRPCLVRTFAFFV